MEHNVLKSKMDKVIEILSLIDSMLTEYFVDGNKKDLIKNEYKILITDLGELSKSIQQPEIKNKCNSVITKLQIIGIVLSEHFDKGKIIDKHEIMNNFKKSIGELEELYDTLSNQ